MTYRGARSSHREGDHSHLEIRLPRGSYREEWVNTESGQVVSSSSFQHDGGARKLAVPEYEHDIALRIKAK